MELATKRLLHQQVEIPGQFQCHVVHGSVPLFLKDSGTVSVKDGLPFVRDLYQEIYQDSRNLKFRQAINRCKTVLEAVRLAYGDKTKESITSQKGGSRGFW